MLWADIYRTLTSKTAEYTLFSSVYGNFSKTDHKLYANKLGSLEEMHKFQYSVCQDWVKIQTIWTDWLVKFSLYLKILNKWQHKPPSKQKSVQDWKALQRNSTKCIKKNYTYPAQAITKYWRGGDNPKFILQGHHYPDTWTRQSTNITKNKNRKL